MLCMSLLGHFFHAWIIHYVSKVLICFAAHTKLSISSHKLRTQGIIPSKYVSHVITERGFSLSGYDTQGRHNRFKAGKTAVPPPIVPLCHETFYLAKSMQDSLAVLPLVMA